MPRIALLSSLKHRPFRLLFSALVISDLGDWLDYLAIIVIIVYQWHLGAPALAAYMMVVFLPAVVIGPFAGVWVDRWPQRLTMITCDLIRAGLVLGLIWAPNIYIMLLIVVAKVTISTFFSPAQQVAIRLIVPEEDLLSANSLNQLSLQATKILGPAVGGLLVLIGGVHIAFVADALSFLVSAAFLSRLPRLIISAAASDDQQKPQFWQEFRAGFAYIFRHRILVVSVSSVAAALFIAFTFDALAPLAVQSLGLDPSILGLAIGSIGLGTAVGAIAIGQWGKYIPSLKLMAFGNVIAGAMVALVGGAVLIHMKPATANAIAVAIIIWLIMGVAVAAMIVPYGYILQTETPPDFLGRVSATASGFQTAVQFLAPLVGALVAVTLGVGVIFSVAGLALFLLGAILLLVRIQSVPPKSDAGVAPADVEFEVS